jgi:hypothetical protein
MSTASRARIVAALTLCLASAVITAAVLQQWHMVAVKSDAELVAQFRGAAFEDVFGFGFWPTWLAVALVQLAIFTAASLLLRAH